MIHFTAAATTLLVWGVVFHLIADFLFQSDSMALNKVKRRRRWLNGRKLLEYNEVPGGSGHIEQTRIVGPWWDRDPAAYIHASIHTVVQLFVFPWWAALAIGAAHFVIDLGWPVDRWSKLVGKTLPTLDRYVSATALSPNRPYEMDFGQHIKIRHDISDPALRVRDAVLQIDADRKALEERMSSWSRPVLDIGTVVKVLTDQCFHVVVLAIAAVVVAG